MANRNVYPVSFAQERLIFLDQLDPGTPVYNLTRLIRLTGILDSDALTKALKRVVQRHASLRTTFVVEDNSYQIVDDEIEFRVPLLDVSHFSNSQLELEALRLAREEAQRSFDLSVGPLFRFALICVGPGEHILVLVMHHIITDGWSMGILFDELSKLYAEYAYGVPADLPACSIQYFDFARGQRENLRARNLQNDVEYWTRKLHGHSGLIELPSDRPRPAIQSHEGAIETFQINEELAAALKKVAEGGGATIFMLLLAALQTLVWRYAGVDDILIGTPVAGRNDVSLEDSIGFFVNTLVIRGDLSDNPTFLELLRRSRQTTLEAYEHQDLPFEKLIEALTPQRDQRYTPLFQIMLVLHNAPKRALELKGLSLKEIEFDPGSTKFDLTLEIAEQDGLYCSFEYSTAIFDQTSIRRLARSFEILLCDIAGNPGRRISELRILDEAAQNELIFDFNSTKAEYRRQVRLEQIFEEQVQRTPDRIALIEGNSKISYRDLNERAEYLARLLCAKGLNQDRPVGVHTQRSIDAVVAYLAALKANTPFVPLDISNPQHRLDLMIGTAGCDVILTHRGLGTSFADDVERISIDEASLDDTISSTLSIQGSSEDLAYIIFTSGSTGTPKGVEGRHRAAMNRFEWMWRTYPFSADEVCCQKSALGFVDSIWEIFGPLLAGIEAVIVPQDVLFDLDQFVALLRQHRVSRIVLVPSLLRSLLDNISDLSERLPNLRLWSSSGEALSLGLARRFREVLPTAQLLNIYGSSEVTADVTWHDVTETNCVQSVPIGKPISNSQIYILDRYKNLVPPLTHGEIHVGGDCLARGYWKQPELTSKRFIPNPYGADPSQVFFATGDLGRFLPDGTIEYFGRIDSQIKLRGIRIEPGEIEATLLSHPLVREALVTIHGESSELHKLIAYVVRLEESRQPLSDELRPFLKARLPDYMIPGLFIELDRMPVLPSGKIDRSALPIPGLKLPLKGRTVAHGRTEIEKRLSSIWQEVLELDQAAIDDNFFDIGGHSLSAMRVLARVRRNFLVNIPIRTLFDRPTIAELAQEIEAKKSSGEVVPTSTIAPEVTGSSALLNLLRAELSKLPPDQLESFVKSIVTNRGINLPD